MAIARDSGASFPLVNGATGTVSSVRVPAAGGFDTSNASTLIVVRVGLANAVPTTQHSVTVAWEGGAPAGASTFTKRSEASGDPITNSHNGSIWTATCDQTITGQAIVVTAAASSSSCAFSVAVDALTGTSRTFGASPPSNWWNGSATAATSSLTIASGSWVFVCAGTESATSLSVQGTTVQDDQRQDVPNAVVGTCGVDTSGVAGSLTVGWGTTTTWGGVAALEVLASTDGSQAETLGFSETQRAERAVPPYTVFQQNAFQSNAFAMLGGGAAPAGPSGSETDTLGLSDIQGSKQTQVSSETDTLGFSDSQVATKGATATQGPETLGFSDSQAAAAGKASSETDTLGFSETQDAAVGGGGTFSGSETDTLGLSDTQSATAGKAASQTDTLGFSDPQAAAKGATASQTDTLGFSDVQAAAAGKSSSQTDTLGFSDGQDAVIGKAVTLSEALGMADAYAAAVSSPSLAGTQTDTLGLSDSYAAANSAIQGAHTDTLGMGDAYAAQVTGAVIFQQRFHVWNGSTWV